MFEKIYYIQISGAVQIGDSRGQVQSGRFTGVKCLKVEGHLWKLEVKLGGSNIDSKNSHFRKVGIFERA